MKKDTIIDWVETEQKDTAHRKEAYEYKLHMDMNVNYRKQIAVLCQIHGKL